MSVKMCVYPSTSCFIGCIITVFYLLWYRYLNSQKTNVESVFIFQSQPLTGPLRRRLIVKCTVAGVERWSGVTFGSNPASLRNCEGDAGYEATTSDLTAVTESMKTNSHLCEGCLIIMHPRLAAAYYRPNLTLSVI